MCKPDFRIFILELIILPVILRNLIKFRQFLFLLNNKNLSEMLNIPGNIDEKADIILKMPIRRSKMTFKSSFYCFVG